MSSRHSSYDEAEEARRSSLSRPRSGSHIFDEPDHGRIGLGVGAGDGRIRQLQGEWVQMAQNSMPAPAAVHAWFMFKKNVLSSLYLYVRPELKKNHLFYDNAKIFVQEFCKFQVLIGKSPCSRELLRQYRARQ